MSHTLVQNRVFLLQYLKIVQIVVLSKAHLHIVFGCELQVRLRTGKAGKRISNIRGHTAVLVQVPVIQMHRNVRWVKVSSVRGEVCFNFS